MDPAINQPRLRWWEHAWRYALALFLSLLSFVEVVDEWMAEDQPWWLWIDIGFGLIAFALIWWRRSHPIVVNVVLSVLSAFSTLAGGPAAWALMSLATRRRWREIVPISILGFVCGIVLLRLDPVDEPIAFLLPFMLALIAVNVGWGLYIGSRRELVANLHERADRAEAEQAMRIAQAQTAERARIAREMHDVMAHRISLVTMHAGALAYRDDLDAGQVKETAQLIQQTSHQALTELREVLGVLRTDSDESSSDRPQPAARDVSTLIEESQEAGMRISSSIDVPLDALPDTIGRTLYRIVQESLTNARKHAPRSSVTLAITGSMADGVSFTVSNPPSLGETKDASGARVGLVGLAERAELVGGRLAHRSTPQQFVVEGWLPWPT